MNARRVWLALLVLVVAGGLAACTPPAADAPPPEPAAATVRVPTLAEFVTTLRVYDEPTVKYARGDAVDDLVHLVFGDLGEPVVECMNTIIDAESSRAWWAHNPGGASGLTQLLHHEDRAELVTGSRDVMNPFTNLATARWYWDTSGIAPWRPHTCPGV